MIYKVIVIVFNAIFNNISVIMWRQFYWCTRTKQTTCRKSVKLYQLILYRVHLAIRATVPQVICSASEMIMVLLV